MAFLTQHRVPQVRAPDSRCQDPLPLKAERYSLVWLDHIWFISSSVEQQWGDFSLLAAANHAAVNTGVQMSVRDPAFSSLGCVPRSKSGFHFLRNFPTVVYTDVARGLPSRLPCTGFQFPHNLAHSCDFLGCCFFLFNFLKNSHHNERELRLTWFQFAFRSPFDISCFEMGFWFL